MIGLHVAAIDFYSDPTIEIHASHYFINDRVLHQ